jgi:arylsulfatase A-like enzyme
VALANWPGHIRAGSVVDQPIHIVDMYPTLAGIAGASLAGTKPLDGVDVRATISKGAASPRTEVVYGVEPFRAAVREGNWKLVWQATLPSRVELFDLAADPGETTNLADRNPEQVRKIQQRIEELARGGVPPLILAEALGTVKSVLFGSVVLPGEADALEEQP